MNDINSLLNIDAGYVKDFHLLANAVVDSQIEKMVDANCKRLQLVQERMMTDYEPVADKRSVEAVVRKVKECVANKSLFTTKWNASELRLVSYYIMYFEDDQDAFQGAIDLLDRFWKKYFYFNGLVFYLLNSWNLLRDFYRKAVSQLVINKLGQYKGKNKKYLMLKNHANYFDDSGPSRMAKLIRTRDMDVLSAPTLLGFKPSTVSMSFYSDVIFKYVEKKDDITIDEIHDLLSAHNLDRTKKLVLAEMVLRADVSGDAILQTNVSKLGQRLLGDITIASAWAPFPGATEDQIKSLQLAKDLVNQWFVRKVIEVFFDICVQDQSRRKFWLNYADMISNFMIAGSSLIKHRLQQDYRVGELFDKLFIETNSRYSQTSALIMNIKDRVFVEFSDMGSLYVYKRENQSIAFLRNRPKYINSVNDLKTSFFDRLVEPGMYSTYLRDEGSMRHAGYWQSRLKLWFKHKLLDNTTTSSNVPDPVFAPVELPQQSSKLDFKQSHYETKDDTPDVITHFSKYMVSDITSKRIFDDRCHIIANSRGFYVAITSETNKNAHRYYHICPLSGVSGPSAKGNIWIKMPNVDKWRPIIHAYGTKEVLVGYIKEGNGEYLFRSGDSFNIKRIKL